LQALRFEDIDLAAGLIRVQRAYDPKAHTYVEPKSKAGKRTTPIPQVLRAFLLAHKVRSAWSKGLAFGRGPESPFTASNVWRRSRTMIAAGVNVKALSTFMGHSSITITLDRYGHLLPGSEEEAAGMLDVYLGRSAGQKWASEGQ